MDYAVNIAGIDHVAGRASDVIYRGHIPEDIRDYIYANTVEPIADQLEGAWNWTTLALLHRGACHAGLFG